MTAAITVAPEFGAPESVAPEFGAAPASADPDEGRALLDRYAVLPVDAPERAALRARLIEFYLPLANHLARRFRNRGESLDDLTQVAYLGLIKSVDGFDAGRGFAFTSYAVPMIVGELKRHFRDKCWDIRVPRRLQELRLEMSRCIDELCQSLGRSPTVSDIATHLGVSEEEIIEGLCSSQAYRNLSLHAPASGFSSDEESTVELADVIGVRDADLDLVENREALRPMLARLPLRERRIISMRFFGNLTQSQIAAELGISQMHVSRLLSQALGKLRADLFR